MDEALIALDELDIPEFLDAPAPLSAPRWRRTLKWIRVHPLLTLSLAFLGLIVFASFFPGVLAPYTPDTAVITALQQPPSASHLFGTDQLGRDVLSRVIYGTQITLIIGIMSTLLAALVGGLVGLVAGYRGGIVDAILMRCSEILLAFPGILLALAIVAAAGPNERDLILAVAIAAMPSYAKLMRNQVHAIRERPYIEASVSTGARRRIIMFGHLVPNAYSSLLGLATLGVGINILAGSSLSFLGLGPPPPSPEWGAMVADSAGEIATSWWMALFPGLAIVLTVLAVSVVGQWLRAKVDVRSGERA